jgi:hypothetical protein
MSAAARVRHCGRSYAAASDGEQCACPHRPSTQSCAAVAAAATAAASDVRGRGVPATHPRANRPVGAETTPRRACPSHMASGRRRRLHRRRGAQRRIGGPRPDAGRRTPGDRQRARDRGAAGRSPRRIARSCRAAAGEHCAAGHVADALGVRHGRRAWAETCTRTSMRRGIARTMPRGCEGTEACGQGCCWSYYHERDDEASARQRWRTTGELEPASEQGRVYRSRTSTGCP